VRKRCFPAPLLRIYAALRPERQINYSYPMVDQGKTVAQVSCLYCGRKIADDLATCPHCGAVSHDQKKGYRAGARWRFMLLFIALAIACLFLIFWLPR
ncbi:MAG: hypothetical protein WBN43_22990, partial [Thiogranum sp.]